jgi:hypothetical protein
MKWFSRRFVRTTDSPDDLTTASNVLDQHFEAQIPNHATYRQPTLVPTRAVGRWPGARSVQPPPGGLGDERGD